MLYITDVGVAGDSLVYIVDGEQRRVLYFDRSEGTFVRVDNYVGQVWRIAWADDSTLYRSSYSSPKRFLFVNAPGHQRTIPPFTSLNVAPIMLLGFVHAHRNRAVYVPKYIPVILTYGPGHTTGVATPTPDYGELPVLQGQTKKGEDIAVTAPPSESAHDLSSLHDGVLSIKRPGVDSLEFDLYDVGDEVSYRHTVRLPLDRTSAVYGRGRVVATRDTTVQIYRVPRR